MTARPIQIQNFWRVPEIRLGAMVALLLAWCAALLTFRVLWTWKLHYTFLVWNLGLATMPLIFSTIFVHAQRRFLSVTAFLLWLLFFPNAPYIITDFTHLQNHSSGPIWFDILLLFSSAAVGLIIGYISLSQVHDLLLSSNHRSLARIVVSVAPFAAAFGNLPRTILAMAQHRHISQSSRAFRRHCASLHLSIPTPANLGRHAWLRNAVGPRLFHRPTLDS